MASWGTKGAKFDVIGQNFLDTKREEGHKEKKILDLFSVKGLNTVAEKLCNNPTNILAKHLLNLMAKDISF